MIHRQRPQTPSEIRSIKKYCVGVNQSYILRNIHADTVVVVIQTFESQNYRENENMHLQQKGCNTQCVETTYKQTDALTQCCTSQVSLCIRADQCNINVSISSKLSSSSRENSIAAPVNMTFSYRK